MKDTVIAVFTTQEEVGCRGNQTAAYSIQPDIGIALDVTLCGDVPEDHKLAVNLGDGPAIKVMDAGNISNPELVATLHAAAKRAKVAVQREVRLRRNRCQEHANLPRHGVPVCTVSIPCRNVHSAVEMVDLRDMDGAKKVVLSYLSGK